MTSIEIFSGSSSVTAEFLKRGWCAYSFDISFNSKAQIIGDARNLPLKKIPIDFMWLSPPCNEFTREFLPWSRTSIEPSTELFKASLDLINIYQPRLWLIENSKGGDHFIGRSFSKANVTVNSWHFWTNVPNIMKFKRKYLNKKTRTIKDPIERGKIPKPLIVHIANQVESFLY